MPLIRERAFVVLRRKGALRPSAGLQRYSGGNFIRPFGKCRNNLNGAGRVEAADSAQCADDVDDPLHHDGVWHFQPVTPVPGDTDAAR